MISFDFSAEDNRWHFGRRLKNEPPRRKSDVKLTSCRLLQVVPARSEVPSGADNELERSIKAAMLRMKKVSADSDSDSDDKGDDETQSGDWDS